MRIGIAGSSGLLGTATARHLVSQGHEIVRLVRHLPGAGERRIDLARRTVSGPGLTDLDAVINFAGAGIADAPWTEERKRIMRASRLATTEAIIGALHEAPSCRVLLNGSAVGYYGDQGDTVLDERSPRGEGYLANVCVQWERAADMAPEDVRVVKLRTGHVLTPKGGILGKQRLLFQLGLGGPIGDGKQYVSWIGVEDYTRAIEFLLTHGVRGPVNMTAPNPVTNARFAKAFGVALGRPAKIPVPLKAASMVFKPEMVQDAMLGSQRALPTVLQNYEFRFKHADIDDAMDAVN